MFLLKVYDKQWRGVSGITVLGQGGGARLGRRGSEAWTALHRSILTLKHIQRLIYIGKPVRVCAGLAPVCWRPRVGVHVNRFVSI